MGAVVKVRGMVCPVCLARPEGRVVRLRVRKRKNVAPWVVKRRMRCPECGFRKTTTERWETPAEAADRLGGLPLPPGPQVPHRTAGPGTSALGTG
jgi:hypothetical protein